MAVNNHAAGERDPLITRSVSALERAEECPRSPTSTDAATPIPWGPMTILLVLNALGPLSYELIFPFISELPIFSLSQWTVIHRRFHCYRPDARRARGGHRPGERRLLLRNHRPYHTLLLQLPISQSLTCYDRPTHLRLWILPHFPVISSLHRAIGICVRSCDAHSQYVLSFSPPSHDDDGLNLPLSHSIFPSSLPWPCVIVWHGATYLCFLSSRGPTIPFGSSVVPHDFAKYPVMPMSWASDAFGRKPVILIGMAGLAVSLVTFGMSRSFAMLVLTRCLGGALGGVWA